MKLTGISTFLVLVTGTAGDVLSLSVAKAPPGSTTRRRSHHLGKRAVVTESLFNNLTQGGYFASVAVGTPGQNMTMILDTGSSDAWVIAHNASLCAGESTQESQETNCWGTYDHSSSSTYNLIAYDRFSIEYADGTAALGNWISDDFVIGGQAVKGLQMGLADDTGIGTGILGIGFASDEAASIRYPNLIDSMKNQSITSRAVYSLYLNSYHSSTGNIIFGGIDTEKFIGELAVVPILPDPVTKAYTSFTVGLSSLSFASSTNGSGYSYTADEKNVFSLDSVLDSGTTLTYLPGDMALDLWEAAGVYVWNYYDDDIALCDCNLNATFTWRFNDTATITAPAEEFVISTFGNYPLPDDIPFDSVCLFGIQSMDKLSIGGTASTYALLGDTFLRSAYVVYDLDNKQIGLAQSNLNSTKTNLQEFRSGETSLPVFTGVTSQEVSSGTSTTVSGSGSAVSTATDSGLEATSTHNSAASARSAPGCEGLFVVVGAILVSLISGSAVFLL